MPACAIRYRLDGPGPATYLIDCDGEYRLYARGSLGAAITRPQLLGELASRGCRWVPASGEVSPADPAVVRDPVLAGGEGASPF